MSCFIDEMKLYINQTTTSNMAEFIKPLAEATDDLAELTQLILRKSQKNPEELGTSANDYLHVFGYTAMAFAWAKMAEVSLTNMAKDENFYQAKLHTARYYFARLLPRRQSLILSASAGAESLFTIKDDWF
jgi:hypothetical protein